MFRASWQRHVADNVAGLHAKTAGVKRGCKEGVKGVLTDGRETRGHGAPRRPMNSAIPRGRGGKIKGAINKTDREAFRGYLTRAYTAKLPGAEITRGCLTGIIPAHDSP